MPILITPAILTDNFTEFTRQVALVESLFSYAQIDVMDGKFVKATSFSEIDLVSDIKTGLRYELHLMVDDPYEELLRWGNVRNVFRIVFHAEAHSDPGAVIEEARARGLEVGVALNPETPISRIETYVHDVDLVQFMTVHPGQQGAQFLPEMKNKIIEFTARPHRPRVAVDGGINPTTIREVLAWGVEICNVGSFLMKSSSLPEALAELRTVVC